MKKDSPGKPLALGIVSNITGCRCRCGHAWIPRAFLVGEMHRPGACPQCKSAYWDQPKRADRAPTNTGGESSA